MLDSLGDSAGRVEAAAPAAGYSPDAHWPNMPLDAHHDAAMVQMKATKKPHYMWNPHGNFAAVADDAGGWPFAVFSVTDDNDKAALEAKARRNSELIDAGRWVNALS